MKNTSSFTEGSILLPLVKFSLPVLFSLILQAMYGTADLWVVGKFSTSEAVSAVSTGSQIMFMITAAVIGLTMGTTVMLGQRGQSEYKNVIGSGICLFAVLAAVLTVVQVAFSDGIAAIMNAPPEAFEQTAAYIRICSLGMMFIVAYNVFGSIFRGIGDSKTPFVTVIIACVLNIAGDLLLVAVLGMGAQGAAAATVISQAVSVVLSVIIVRRRGLPFEFSRKDIRFRKKYILHTLRLGFPIALQDSLVGLSFLVIIAIVNTLGLVASAGVGVAEKLCAFIMLVPSAFMQSMSAFVAHNIGAGKYGRAQRSLLCCIAISLCCGVLMFFLTFFHGDVLAGLFTDEPEVIFAAAQYLRSYAIDCLFTSFLFSFIGYFNGCGKTAFVMVQGILGAFCIRIPVAYLMSRRLPVSLFHVGLATPASSLVQIILCGIYFFITSRSMKNNEQNTIGD